MCSSDLIDSGTQLRPYSTEILDAAREVADELLTENAASDPAFKEVFDRWSAFRERVRAWNTINELSFASYAMGQGESNGK